jgi:TRAP-type mannitol/chloroaromatic compound transport system permease large subunit
MGTAARLTMGTAGRLLFIALVTCYLLGRIFAGVATPLETVVYGATAAFGLEFLLACWRDLWQRG